MNIGNFLAARLNPGIAGALSDLGVMNRAPMGGGPTGMGGMSAEATASPDKERLARERGFRSYEEMMLWLKNQNIRQGAPVEGQLPQGSAGQGRAQPAAQPRKPTNMFNRIREAMQGALPGN